VEASKAAFFSEDAARKANALAVIDFILSHTLRLFHPFLPFITEEIWSGLGYNADLPEDQGGRTIMFSHWPKPLGEEFKAHYALDETDSALAAAKYETVTLGRNLRTSVNIPFSKKVRFVIKPNTLLSQHDTEVLRILLNAEAIEVAPNYEAPKGTPVALTPLGELFLPLEGLVDVEAEKTRLDKEIQKVQSEIEKVQTKLANPNFTEKVPPAVLEEHKQRLTAWQEKLAQIQKMREAL
jgi:valyl-tRNA synthetase